MLLKTKVGELEWSVWASGRRWNLGLEATKAQPWKNLSGLVLFFFFFFFNKFILFIYFWLRWVFVAARGLFLVA